MILSRPLTPGQRHSSQVNYNRFCSINGLSYMCLGETVVILFATKLDAPNTVIAAVGAMLYLGYLLLPLGIRRAAAVGAARCQADFWIVRNLAALLVAASVLLRPLGDLVAWGNLLLWCFVFYGSRAAGLVLAQPLIGDITTSEDRAKLLGESCARFYLSAVCSLIAVSAVLHLSDSLWTLTGIMCAGSLCGIFASSFIRRIHETEVIRQSAQKPILAQLPKFARQVSLRRQVYAGIVCNAANIMLVSMSITALKRGYGYSDTTTIIFSTVLFGACFLGSKLNAVLANRFGPRNLSIGAYLLVFPVCLLWYVFPERLPQSPLLQAVLALPFLLLGFYVILYMNSLIHYFLNAVPKEDQVVETVCINLITGVGGSLLAMGLASALLALAEHLAHSDLQVFKTYFAATGVLLLLGLPVLASLPRLPVNQENNPTD